MNQIDLNTLVDSIELNQTKQIIIPQTSQIESTMIFSNDDVVENTTQRRSGRGKKNKKDSEQAKDGQPAAKPQKVDNVTNSDSGEKETIE